MKRMLTMFVMVLLTATLSAQGQKAKTPNPVIVVETDKGVIEIELTPKMAPKGVEKILGLVEKNFYRGLRVHRVTPNLVQFGDPQTRNMRNQNSFGSGGSGTRVGVAEITPGMKHVRGAVGFAYSGEAKFADSQLYIMKNVMPGLDGDYSIIGRVISGITVADRLQPFDVIKNITLKAVVAK
jgi:cyclophilin family peptidyl-prolyl cis-trans isomerase